APRLMLTDFVEPEAPIVTVSFPAPAVIDRLPRLRLTLSAIVTVAPPPPRLRLVAPPTEKLSEAIVTVSPVAAPRLSRLKAPPMLTFEAAAKAAATVPLVATRTLPVTLRLSLTFKAWVPAPRAAATEPLTLTVPLSVAATSPAPVTMARPRAVRPAAALVPSVIVVLAAA